MRLRFRHSRAGLFVVGDYALEVLRDHEQHLAHETEAGGLLVGRYLRDGHDIIVDAVTVPQPTDARSRHGYQRDPAAHNAFLDWAWNVSDGHFCYVGSWHTHPEPRPTPSLVDLDGWMRETRENEVEDEAQFFMIVGQLEVRVWEGNRRTGEITSCPAA